jgi:hypothetical protein
MAYQHGPVREGSRSILTLGGRRVVHEVLKSAHDKIYACADRDFKNTLLVANPNPIRSLRRRKKSSLHSRNEGRLHSRRAGARRRAHKL